MDASKPGLTFPGQRAGFDVYQNGNTITGLSYAILRNPIQKPFYKLYL